MLKILYFLILLAASAEDIRHYTVRPRWIVAVGMVGFLNCITKENRWVTMALTCACFLFLFLFYKVIQWLAARGKFAWAFGGADVRLIPGMMLAQGWDTALEGIFMGLFCAVIYHVAVHRQRKEIPLVPWMSAGCLLVELLLYFFAKWL